MSKNTPKNQELDPPETDFSRGVRGKFYRRQATLVPPVHLEPEVLRLLQARALKRKTTLSDLVNELLRKDIEVARLVAEADDPPPASRKRAGL